MRLRLKDSLPFVSLTVTYRGLPVEVPEVLVDTGSATTILAADIVEAVRIAPSPEDALCTLRGVGGNEVVFTRRVDSLRLGHFEMAHFEIEIGGMDYGFDINGILGMDCLTRAGAVINLRDMEIDLPKP
ncbi:MAG: retropepsin-like aspartic protease [Acidobacteriota bacterium]